MNILNPGFRWIPPDDDSTAFRARQMARMAAAQRAKADAAQGPRHPGTGGSAASSPLSPQRSGKAG